MIGSVKMTRRFVDSDPSHDLFLLHTNMRDTSFFDEDLKATMAIVHGFSENSDIFLESALQYA